MQANYMLADIAFAVAGTPIEIAVKSALPPLGEDDVEETPIVDVVIDLLVVVAVALLRDRKSVV